MVLLDLLAQLGLPEQLDQLELGQLALQVLPELPGQQAQPGQPVLLEHHQP